MKHRKYLLLISSLLLTFSLSACDKKNQDELLQDEVSTDELLDASTQDEQHADNYNNESVSSVESETVNQELKIPDMPLNQYHDVNQDSDFSWITPLYIAQSTQEFSDEEKLNLLSPEYYNETDAFKKQDLKKTLMPKLEQQIAQYKGDYRVKLPIRTDGNKFYYEQAELNLTKSYKDYFRYVGAYDFDSKSFPINCEEFDLTVTNEQNIRIYTADSKSARKFGAAKFRPVIKTECKLEVEDESLARKIEEARADGRLWNRGNFYFKLEGKQDFIEAYPVFAEFTYYDTATGEDLISKEIHYGAEKIN